MDTTPVKVKPIRARDSFSRIADAPRIAAAGAGAARVPAITRPVPVGDAMAHARALARWESEGGRVMAANREPLGEAEGCRRGAYTSSKMPAHPAPRKRSPPARISAPPGVPFKAVLGAPPHATVPTDEAGWAEKTGLGTGEVQAEPESTSRLHELLAEQTSALQAAHMRLRMSDRLASIGALAAGLGHDMNNVLLPVRAHLEAASAGALVPEVRRHVDAVRKSVAYLQQLADGLHFLALDTEGDGSERAETDVAAWWSQVGPLLTNAVPKHVSVAVSIPAGLPKVAVSAHGLTQAVLNLVVNAGEAIPPPASLPGRGKQRKGLVRITAKAHKDGLHVSLDVADNGQGMSQENQRRAFEMFYTSKARELGTGLGLPLVARVVSRAGGSVHIESRFGAGTTVSLLLPVAGRPERVSHSPCAVVAVRDGRVAAMIWHLLEVTGIQVIPGREPAQADIWVSDSTPEGLAGAKAWRQQHPRGGLVLLGKPDPAAARAWNSLRPVVIEGRDDLDALRAALGQVIAGP